MFQFICKSFGKGNKYIRKLYIFVANISIIELLDDTENSNVFEQV